MKLNFNQLNNKVEMIMKKEAEQMPDDFEELKQKKIDEAVKELKNIPFVFENEVLTKKVKMLKEELANLKNEHKDLFMRNEANEHELEKLRRKLEEY